MYLGIDIGTSSVKTVLFDRDQRLIGQASQALPGVAPASGLVRAGPRGLVAGGRGDHRHAGPRARRWASCAASASRGRCTARCCLDHDDRVLRPAILWNDGRAMAECAEIEAAFPRAREVAGNIAMPGFTAPKIAWLRKHEPEVYRHIDAVLLAQGLRAAAPDRPPRLGDVGRLRHLLARRGGARLVGRPARGDRAVAQPDAAAGRRQRALGRAPAGARRSAGARAGRWWWPAAPATTPRPPAASGW